jgi:hypothetical protein
VIGELGATLPPLLTAGSLQQITVIIVALVMEDGEFMCYTKTHLIYGADKLLGSILWLSAVITTKSFM